VIACRLISRFEGRGGLAPTGQWVVQLRTPAALKLAFPMTLRERFYKGMKNGGRSFDSRLQTGAE
jgi:hypothetical protein